MSDNYSLRPTTTSQPPVQRVAVILNPNAGSWKRFPDCDTAAGRAQLVGTWFGIHSEIDLAVRETRSVGDGKQQAIIAIGDGYDTIVAAGGDGTVREVIAGLYSVGEGRLGILPLGTANVLARSLKIPVNIVESAVSTLFGGSERCIDLGLCNGMVFALHAGIGLDGLVVHRIDPRAKRRLGRIAYVITSAVAAMHMAPVRVRIVPDGRENEARSFRTYQVFVANISEYGGDLRLADSVNPSDGLLDLFVCKHRWSTLGSALLDALSLASGTLARSRGIEYVQVRSVEIESDPPCWVQLDGDAFGRTPLSISIAPHSLRILAPPLLTRR